MARFHDREVSMGFPALRMFDLNGPAPVGMGPADGQPAEYRADVHGLYAEVKGIPVKGHEQLVSAGCSSPAAGHHSIVQE